MLYVLIGFVSIALSYFFFKPLWRRYNLKKVFLILFPVSVLVYFAIMYFIVYSKPASFRTAVELLSNDSTMVNKIGGYESYSYFEKDMPDQKDNPAFVRFSLNGPKGELYLSCKVIRDTSGDWSLVYVKQDSLVKK